jgi:protein tyrosine phosphatase (PTP) superfamily phosphohydrolase (DUF442 family)
VILFLSHDDENDSDIQAEKQVAADEHVQFLNFPMMGDGVAKPEMYTRALLALCDANRAGRPVLVHCHSGAQRTGGVVAVYRMLVQKMPPEQVLAEMRHYGHDPRKNLTLIPFLNEHLGEWAAALVKDGVIDRVPDPLPRLNPNRPAAQYFEIPGRMDPNGCHRIHLPGRARLLFAAAREFAAGGH